MFGTSLKIENKVYSLKIDINTVCHMKANGIDVLDMGNIDLSDIVVLREIFFYSLQKFHKKEINTVEKAGTLMTQYLDSEEGSFQEFAKTIAIVMSRSLGNKAGVLAEEAFDKAMAEANGEETQEQGK